MKHYYALTVIGKDKPGIVSSVAKVLYEWDFNIEDSSSTLLRDQFSMILIVSTEKEVGLIDLKKAFAKARKNLQLSISVRKIEVLDEQKQQARHYMISIYGSDKKGIVYKTTKALSDLDINIVDLKTRVSGAKKDIYIMILEVEVPPKVNIGKVNEILDEIAKEMGVDFSIRPVESYNI
ncbi:glycine cleavage system protein R [Desulfurella sp.]|uniref:glycine cleavage system protein R n=1 Tax=Desulfurella sp. TaxID=1962857 RepID=UPI003D09EF1A